MNDGACSDPPSIVFEANPDNSSRDPLMEISNHLSDDSNSQVAIASKNISKVILHDRGSKSHLRGKRKLKKASNLG